MCWYIPSSQFWCELWGFQSCRILRSYSRLTSSGPLRLYALHFAAFASFFSYTYCFIICMGKTADAIYVLCEKQGHSLKNDRDLKLHGQLNFICSKATFECCVFVLLLLDLSNLEKLRPHEFWVCATHFFRKWISYDLRSLKKGGVHIYFREEE
jgi:hypothetical protein